MSQPPARAAAGRGRPRTRTSTRTGLDPVEEILDAAAALFVDHGYAATTTRAITARVGIRQGALYYHFASKDEILAELLRRIIARPLRVAGELAALPDVPASVRLAALVRCDAGELLGARHNVGSLFLLPEVRRGGFEEFREQRRRLRDHYLGLVVRAVAEDGLDPLPSPVGAPADEIGSYLVDAVFGLVESVIAVREDRPVHHRALIADAVQASALRVLGHDGPGLLAVVEAAGRRFGDLTGPVAPGDGPVAPGDGPSPGRTVAGPAAGQSR